jgi:hypothetical protein
MPADERIPCNLRMTTIARPRPPGQARVVDAATARSIAHSSHAGQRTATGATLDEHVERVAAGVPPEARVVAFLHDVLERTETGRDELVSAGLTDVELAAVELLTRRPGESYELYVLRVAHARGPEGRLARMVKMADLDDHLRFPRPAGAPHYDWARRHIEFAQFRLKEC